MWCSKDWVFVPVKCSATVLPGKIHAQRSLADISSGRTKLIDHEMFYLDGFVKSAQISNRLFENFSGISSIMLFQSIKNTYLTIYIRFYKH